MTRRRTSNVHAIAFGRDEITFTLRRSSRRTLGIVVQPDTSVVVTAPRGAKLEAVSQKVRRRAVWIRRQQRYFEDFQPTQPKRLYVAGETHRYLGRQYRLKIVRGSTTGVCLKRGFITVHLKGRVRRQSVKTVLDRWYLSRAEIVFERSLGKCLTALNGHVTTPPKFRLRRMRKRWGSYTRRGEVLLNPELILAPTACIDYVVTHELCHLLHPHHGRTFYEFLKRVLPDWQARKRRLELVFRG
jgi:predicted metal-dependent hydrolase